MLWVPVADGLQPLMIEESPDIYFYPRYVGAGGWVGILLDQIADAPRKKSTAVPRATVKPESTSPGK